MDRGAWRAAVHGVTESRTASINNGRIRHRTSLAHSAEGFFEMTPEMSLPCSLEVSFMVISMSKTGRNMSL